MGVVQRTSGASRRREKGGNREHKRANEAREQRRLRDESTFRTCGRRRELLQRRRDSTVRMGIGIQLSVRREAVGVARLLTSKDPSPY